MKRNIVKHYKKYFKGKCLDLGSEPTTIELMPKDAVGLNINPRGHQQILRHDLNTNRLPFPDKTFDFIFFSHTIEHLDSPHLILKECWRVLKPQGKMILAVPRFVPWNRSNYIKREHGHINFWTGRTIKHTLKMHGFKVLRTWVNYFPNLPGVYYLFQYTPLRAIAKDIHILCEKPICKKLK